MGRPKWSLPFAGETLLQRVTQIVGGVVSPVVIVAAPEQALPPLPHHVRIVRDEEEGLGPLAGLAIGLAVLPTEVDAAYVSACDAPLLRPELIRELISRIGTHEVAIPREADTDHPLSAIYRTSLAIRSRQLVAQGERRLMALVRASNALTIDAEELRRVDPALDSLRNINTPADYEALLASANIAATPDAASPPSR